MEKQNGTGNDSQSEASKKLAERNQSLPVEKALVTEYDKVTFKALMELAKVMSGPKRMFLLYMLAKEPMGFTQMDRTFKGNGIPIGSSEIYKHVHMLVRNRLITQFGKIYSATLKGTEFIKSLSSVVEMPDKNPKIKAIFD